MELGTYRLAEINKGGGLRQKPSGEATQYLNGVGEWVAMPTAMTPTAHNHAASEITSGQLALARIPTGTSSSTVALGNHTHLYAGSATAGGPATTALACTGNAATATDASFVGNDYHIPVLGGGQYSTQIGTVTGALIISLPKSWMSTMLRFTVSIYNYSTNSSIDYFVGGYPHITSSSWLNCFAYCLSNKGSNLENLPVSFGYYNGKCAIQIGAVSTVWSYPQVIVHDLLCGYSSCDYTTWKTGWAVSFSATEITAAGPVLSGIRPRASRAENADILTTPRALTIGSTAKNFDGSAAVSWTLAEIGAASSGHMHLYAGSASAGGPATTALACTGSSASVANALTVGTGISLNSGTTYDGSSAKTISINQSFTPTWTGKHIFTGGIQANDLTASRAVITDAYKNLVSSTATATEVGYLSGVTTSIQTQLDGKLSRLRMENIGVSSLNFSGNAPFNALALKASGYPLYTDPEFSTSTNGVVEYGLASGNLERVEESSDSDIVHRSGNSSGYSIKITQTGVGSYQGRGLGGFLLSFISRVNAVFVSCFRAKIPEGYALSSISNALGTGPSTVWLTDNLGTGRWEWYAVEWHCGYSGTFSNGGYFYLTGATPSVGSPLYWYISYANVIDVTKGEYDGNRVRVADYALSSAASAAELTVGTGLSFASGSSYNGSTDRQISLNQAVTPIWTGAHIFTNSIQVRGAYTANNLNVASIRGITTSNTVGSLYLQYGANSSIYLGNTAAHTISADGSSYSGNASTATELATPRTISLTGSVTGSVSFDGSGDVSITTETNHSHAWSSVTDKPSSYSPTSHASSANTYGLATASLYGHAMASSATPLVAGTASVGTDNGKFAREGHVHPAQTSVSGSSASCTGNAATATKLAASVTLTIGSTGKSFDGSAALTWTLAEIGALPTSGGALTGDLSIGASYNLTLSKHAGLNRLAYFDSTGAVQSSASYTLSSFASSSHNHDSTYLKLSGGTVTGQITLDTNGGIYKSGWDGNRIAYFVSGDLTTSSDYTLSSFALATHNHDGVYSPTSHTHSGYALATHNHDSAYSAIGHDHSGTYAAASHTHSGYAATSHLHSIPDLYCGVPDIVSGRLLISGSGGSSNPTWLAAGTNGKILGWTSGAPAWVDAPSGSSVSAANPTASVGLAAVNGSAATFMRSDAAPKLDVSIAPTWTGAHTFNGLTRFTNIGVGVAPSAAYKLYVVEDKEITTAGSYIGNYLIAKYNTALTSGTRQGIALLGQLWATGGTLTEAKGLDFKVYVPSGTVTEATAINAVIQTDGGSIGTAYALKLSRSGTAPTVANYGIYQDDSAATNVFNGPCQFNGGTNLETGRVRNFLNLSASTTLTPAAGTDLLVMFETSGATTQTLTLPATNMAGRAGDIIRVVLCGQCKLTFSTGSGNLLIKPAYYGATANYLLTTQSITGDWTFICDGTYWRAQMLPQLFE